MAQKSQMHSSQTLAQNRVSHVSRAANYLPNLHDTSLTTAKSSFSAPSSQHHQLKREEDYLFLVSWMITGIPTFRRLGTGTMNAVHHLHSILSLQDKLGCFVTIMHKGIFTRTLGSTNTTEKCICKHPVLFPIAERAGQRKHMTNRM